MKFLVVYKTDGTVYNVLVYPGTEVFEDALEAACRVAEEQGEDVRATLMVNAPNRYEALKETFKAIHREEKTVAVMEAAFDAWAELNEEEPDWYQ